MAADQQNGTDPKRNNLKDVKNPEADKHNDKNGRDAIPGLAYQAPPLGREGPPTFLLIR